MEVVEHLVHHLHPVAHPLELHVQVDELGLVLAPLVAVRRREGLQLPCIELKAEDITYFFLKIWNRMLTARFQFDFLYFVLQAPTK